MSQKEVTRRSFLARASVLGLAAMGTGAVLTACGGGSESGSSGGEAAAPPEPAPSVAAEGCNDLSGLTDPDVQMRQTLAYVDESTFADKNCANCQLYIVPEGGATCGGCQIIKGPIAPDGYCTSWAAKVS